MQSKTMKSSQISSTNFLHLEQSRQHKTSGNISVKGFLYNIFIKIFPYRQHTYSVYVFMSSLIFPNPIDPSEQHIHQCNREKMKTYPSQ